VVEELLGEAHTAATKLLREHTDFLAAVSVELLAEETLTLADVNQIAIRLGVAHHAHVPAPRLPVQVSVVTPVVAPEVPSVVAAAAAERVGAGRRSWTGWSARRRPMALVRELLPWRRRRDDERVIAEG